MLKSGAALIGLLVVLTGCSTPRRGQHGPGAPDWSAAKPTNFSPEIEQVPEGPRLAPPPGAIPETSPPSAAPAQTVTPENWISLADWSAAHGFGPLRQLAPAPEAIFAMTTTNGVLTVRAGSLMATWDGVEVMLGFEPRFTNGEPFLNALDLEKNVEPLLAGCPLPAPPGRTLVIDPGHGGENTGTRSVLDGACEKEFTLDWALQLAPLLQAEGWRVFLTRTNDVFVSLADRVAFAARHHADLFLSLHFNSAAPDQEQSGLETYCLTPVGMPSTLTRGYPDDASEVFTNNAFDAGNVAYAFQLQRALLAVVGQDRGVRRARFMTVLRGQSCPAVLIEGGFLSNPREAALIADPAYREKLAEAVARALR